MRVPSRPILALALCLVLALGVAACGGSSSSSSGSSGSTGSSESSTESGGKIEGTVSLWDYEYNINPGYKEAMDELTPIFEKEHPGVKVERIQPPGSNYEALLQAAFTSQEGPDIVMLPPGALGVVHWAKGLVKLNDLISKEEQEQLIGWEMDTPGFTAEGDRYALPVTLNGFVYYYNKKMFKEAGLPTDFQPKTWDEVREVGEKLKAAGMQPFSGGNKDGAETCFGMSTGWQSTNTYQQAIELANGSLPFTDKAVEEALNPLLMMQEAGLYGPERFNQPFFLEGIEAFGEEKGAMTLGLAGGFGEYPEKLGEENVGVFFAPESEYESYETNTNFAIPDFTKNQAGAVAYLEFLGSQRSIQSIVDHTGVISNRKDVSLPAHATPLQKEIAKEFTNGKTEPYICGMLEAPVANGSLEPEVAEVMQGRKSLPDALQATQEVAERSGD
jgi:raffinose/stachyose/melibiose transport system substrate-binding protein